MGWLIGWLIFGVAAAYEAGQLAAHSADQMTQLRALGFALASAFGLAMTLRRAVGEGRSGLAAALAAAAAGVGAAGLWWLYGLGAGPWVTTALALSAYFLACLVLALAGWALALRRQRARALAREKALLEQEHHTRLERIRAEAAAAERSRVDLAAQGEIDDFALPQRPRWED